MRSVDGSSLCPLAKECAPYSFIKSICLRNFADFADFADFAEHYLIRLCQNDG